MFESLALSASFDKGNAIKKKKARKIRRIRIEPI